MFGFVKIFQMFIFPQNKPNARQTCSAVETANAFPARCTATLPAKVSLFCMINRSGHTSSLVLVSADDLQCLRSPKPSPISKVLIWADKLTD